MNEKEYFGEAIRLMEPVHKRITYKGIEYVIVGRRNRLAIQRPPGHGRENDWEWELYLSTKVVRRRWFRSDTIKDDWKLLLRNNAPTPESLEAYKKACIQLIELYYQGLEQEKSAESSIKKSMEKFQAWDGNLD